MKIFVPILLSLCLAAGVAQAQGVGASGDITGTVTDPSGAVVTNATVTATDAEKGIKRTAATDDRGQYRVTGLLPTIYDVSAQAQGFQSDVHKGVGVNVGQVVVVDFHLSLSKVSTQVQVSFASPIVETERGHQADTVNWEYIKNLPIDRRDYLTITLLNDLG